MEETEHAIVIQDGFLQIVLNAIPLIFVTNMEAAIAGISIIPPFNIVSFASLFLDINSTLRLPLIIIILLLFMLLAPMELVHVSRDS